LRIKVNKQHSLALTRQSVAQITGCGRFAGSAFLIGDSYDFAAIHSENPPVFSFFKIGNRKMPLLSRKLEVV
jgi:hypothetical protein